MFGGCMRSLRETRAGFVEVQGCGRWAEGGGEG